MAPPASARAPPPNPAPGRASSAPAQPPPAMAPKRERDAPLPGDDRFGGDYSDAKRAQIVRSDGARKRGAWRYGGGPVRCDLPEFDRLRRVREREIDRRRREQLLSAGASSSSAGASSSSAAPGPPPPAGYDPEHYGVTLGPEDFIPDDQLERTLAATLLRSQNEAAEFAAKIKRDEELDEVLMEQTLIISQLPPVIVLDSDEE